MKAMKNLYFCLCLWGISVSGGVIKDTEELPPEAVADNSFLEDYAINSPLTEDERKIVALLERIQTKFGTLDETEKDEFVSKMASYQARFISTLDKVETIPGTYGLDVPMLRVSLGLPGPDETIEEIHDPRDPREMDIPDATVETVESEVAAPAIEASVSMEDASPLERAAAPPPTPSPALIQSLEPQRTLDDIFEVMTVLGQLLAVQIVQHQKKSEEAMSLANYYYNPPRSVRPFNQPAARGPPVGVGAPPVVHDFVNVDFYTFNKRSRRSSVDEEEHVETENIDEDDEALRVAEEYEDWYNNVYMPWYNNYVLEMEDMTAKFWECEGTSTRVNNPPFADLGQPCFLEGSGSCGVADGNGECHDTTLGGADEIIPHLDEEMLKALEPLNEKMQKVLEPLNQGLMQLLGPLNEQMMALGLQ